MQDNYRLIEDYLEGRLSGEELGNFTRALEKDDKLKDEVQKQKVIIDRLHALRINKKVKNAVDNSKKHNQSNFLAFNRWAAAASIVLFGLLIWIWQKDKLSTQEIVDIDTELNTITEPETISKDSSFLPDGIVKNSNNVDQNQGHEIVAYIDVANSQILFPQDNGIRSIENKELNFESKSYQLVAKYFKEREYQKVLIELNKIPVNNFDENMIFLKAFCLFQTKKFSLASKEFIKLENDIQFMYEAKWNNLICQLALGKLEYVNTNLKLMVSDLEFPYRHKAKELQEKLKR
jgi:hypothetical protein